MLAAFRVRDVAIAVALLATTSHVFAAEGPATQPEQAGFAREGIARIDAYIQNEVDTNKIPGAVMLIRRNGETAYFKSFGVRGPATKAPMTPDTIFRIYSMSKPITTVAAMMLVEEGKLQLDDPLSKYIPAFANVKVGVEVKEEDGSTHLDLAPVKRPITIQDLMRHTSGLTYGFFGEGMVKKAYVEAKLGEGDPDLAEFTERLAKLPLAHRFGLGFAVRTDAGIVPYEGSVGEMNWSGAGGTTFWIDRQENMFAVFMAQTIVHRSRLRITLKNVVYGAFEK